MTIQELIDELQKIEDKNLPVCIYQHLIRQEGYLEYLDIEHPEDHLPKRLTLSTDR